MCAQNKFFFYIVCEVMKSNCIKKVMEEKNNLVLWKSEIFLSNISLWNWWSEKNKKVKSKE